MFLEQCKYVVKERKMPKYITDNMEVYSSKILVEVSDEANPNKENSDEEKSDKEISTEENSDENTNTEN